MSKNSGGKSLPEEAFELGGIGIVVSYVIFTFFPAQVFFAKAFLIISLGGVAFYAKTFSKYNKIFKALELGHDNSYPLLKSKTKKNGYIEYIFTLPNNKEVADFDKVKEKIQQAVGKQLEFEYRFRNLVIKEYLENMKDKYPFEYIETKDFDIPIGYKRTNELFLFDLTKGKPHALLAGETGGGKSTAVRSIITWLILKRNINIELFLVDLKRGVEFKLFQNVDRVKEFIKTKSDVIELLRKLNAEVERRYDLFFDNDCVDIYKYNKKHKSLPYMVLVIDEYADLAEDDDITDNLNELARKARACGIHIIICTQKVEARILDTRIQANFSVRIGLAVTSTINSQTIIGHGGLEKLKGEGHAIFKAGLTEIELKCPFLDSDLARELVKPYNIIKQQKNKEPEIIDVQFTEVFDNDYET